MKTIWSVLSIIAVAHMLALIGLLGFLFATDRVSHDRLNQARDMFKLTVAEQADLDAEQAEQAEKDATEKARLDRLDEPNEGVESRNATLRRMDESLYERMQRYEQELANMQQQLLTELQLLEEAKSNFQKEKEAAWAELERQRALTSDEQFQKNVDIFKGLEPEQQKSMVEEYLAAGEDQLVLDILNALDKKTAQRFFAAFENPADVQTAADLLKRLGEHGSMAIAP